MGIKILVTDRNLNRIGDPIDGWDSVNCTLRFNEPSSGQFTVPGYQGIRDQIEPAHRVMVIRDGQIFLAGPIERAMYERSDDGENSGDGKYTVTFADDLALIAGYITYPDPSVEPEDQMVDHWTYSGNAETAIRSLVNLNCGPGAMTERRIPRLALADVAGVGTDVTVKTRLEPVCEVLRQAARDGGGLGFRTWQDDKDILFGVYQPNDLSTSVKFGVGLNNLRYLGYERVAPTATTAVVGGQGEDDDRYIIRRTDTDTETAWGRREVLVPRPGGSPQEELEEAGDNALSEGSETARLQASAYDSPDQKYGVHFGLGDRVSIQVWPGYAVSELVRMVNLQAWATAGELVSVMVGTQEALSNPAWIRRLRQIDRRVGRLERTVIPAAIPT